MKQWCLFAEGKCKCHVWLWCRWTKRK